MAFGIARTLDAPFEEALARVPVALAAEGFGVLTEIDVQATFKKKLGVDFRRYRILGACNPAFAHEAMGHTLDVGMLLPCNVVVYETDEGAVVPAVDPMQTMAAHGDPALRTLAEQVRARLQRVIDSL
ncbi:MAG: DUF302 domain-containing protein [Vicinamibacteria bacterium]